LEGWDKHRKKHKKITETLQAMYWDSRGIAILLHQAPKIWPHSPEKQLIGRGE
jgi:hypothetical protein